MNEQEEYKETWFIVPRSIVDIPGITLSSLKVFETIFQFWNKGRRCYLSNPEIERRTGVKLTQVKDAISFFEKHQELERVQIGLKRYLMQPLKVVEIPGLVAVPKEVARNQASCTKVVQEARNRAGGSPKSGQGVARNRATEIKKLNKEIKKTDNKGSSFSIEKALEENPHNLSLEILEEWNSIRIKKHKSPLTERAWKRTNSVLSELIGKGLKLDDIIDRMLAAEWRGVEVSYFKSEISELNPKANKFPTPDERAANQQKIIERETKAQLEKQREIEASKGLNDLVRQAKEHISLHERLRIHQEKLEKEKINEPS